MREYERFNCRDELIVPDDYKDSAEIWFSSRLDNKNNRQKYSPMRVFRYEFKCDLLKNISLNDYNDFGKALFALSEHYITNHYFTQMDKNFLYDFNLFRRDKIVLQFSVVGSISQQECIDIQWDFIDAFIVALKIYCSDKTKWKPLDSDGHGHNLEYILEDFLEAVEEGYAEMPNERFVDFIHTVYLFGD